MDARLGWADRKTKLHMGFVFAGLRCANGSVITDVIAAVHDGASRDELLAVLNEANVPAARLCCHCFAASTRRAYAELRSQS
jgi:hypothetical protein